MPGTDYYRTGLNRELKEKSKARANAFKRASAKLRDKHRDEFDKIKDAEKRYTNRVKAYAYALSELRNNHRDEFDVLYEQEKSGDAGD